jgi:nucleotide-binding universal stress UspA family protein
MSGFEFGTDGPKAILVGLDGSETSLRAAAYAAGLARRQSAQLIVVYVRSAPPMASLAVSTAGPIQEMLDEATADLRQQVLAGAANAGISAEFIAADGDPYTELVRVAERVRVDAVVVGASSKAGHRLIGSIALRLVRAARWPVTVVP